jgi:hypothetical protein
MAVQGELPRPQPPIVLESYMMALTCLVTCPTPSLYVKMALTCRSPYLYPILLGRQAPFDGDVAGLGTSSVTWQSPGQWGSPVYRPPPS